MSLFSLEEESAGLEAGSCAKAQPVNRITTREPEQSTEGRREAKLKMGLLDFGMSRSVP